MEKQINKGTSNYRDLMYLGFPEHTSRDIIRQAKKIAIMQFEKTRQKDKKMITLKKSPFDNQRLGIAPTKIVEALIGFSLSDNEESEK